MPRTLLGVLLSLAAGVFLSTGGIALRLVESADGFQILFYRALTFSVLMAVVMALCYRRGFWRAIRAVGREGAVVAIALGLGAMLYVQAILNTSVANAVVILSTSPLLTALLAWGMLRRRVSVGILVASAVASIGVAIMVTDGLDTGGLLGMLIAFGAAMSFAVMLVGLQSVPERDMLPATAMSGLVTLSLAWLVAADLNVSVHDMGVSAYLGAFQFGLGFALVTLATRYIDGALVALLTLSEVVLAPLWVWIGVGEAPTAMAAIGGAIVFAAVISQALRAWRTGRG